MLRPPGKLLFPQQLLGQLKSHHKQQEAVGPAGGTTSDNRGENTFGSTD